MLGSHYTTLRKKKREGERELYFACCLAEMAGLEPAITSSTVKRIGRYATPPQDVVEIFGLADEI